MDFNFYSPIKVISSKGCVRESSALLKKLGSRTLIVTGGSSAVKSGALQDVCASLEAEDISYSIYNKITENPRLDHCHEAACLARDFGAEFIIGIGGGSPLDAAKAVAVYSSNPELSEQDIYSCTERNRALPLVLIGTTAGTGSEVGRVSVLTDPKTSRKKSISPEDCYPTLTLADPAYTHSMPYQVTVSTALDALAHALEGYMSVKCGDLPTLFAERAIPLIWEGLCFLHKTGTLPDETLREKLYYGSLYAGLTLSCCGTAFPHPMGYILTEHYGVPHGKACAVFMEEFILRSSKAEKEKTERFLSLIGTSLGDFITIIKELTDLECIKMTEQEIEAYCERFDTPPANFRFSPGGFTKSDARELLRKLFS